MCWPDHMAAPVVGVSSRVGKDPYTQSWVGSKSRPIELALGGCLQELSGVALEDLSSASVLGLHDEVPGLREFLVELCDVVEVFLHDGRCHDHLFRLPPPSLDGGSCTKPP